MSRLVTEPLSQLLEALGAKPRVSESADMVVDALAVDGGVARKLDFKTVKLFADAYGKAIQCAEIGLDGQPCMISMTPLPGETAFYGERAQFQEGLEYTFNLRLDKRLLLKSSLEDGLAGTVVFWFYSANIEDQLTEGLDEFATSIWNTGSWQRRLLLVGDTDLHNRGPILTVIGGKHLEPLPENALPAADDSAIRLARQMYDRRVELITWDRPWTSSLTPVHLQLDSAPGSTALERLLTETFVRLCLLYTCNRARDLGPERIRIEYRGGTAGVFVPLPEDHALPVQIDGQGCSALGNLVSWCYQRDDSGDWTSDRLQFTQVLLAQRLESIPEGERLSSLISNVRYIVESRDQLWLSFIHGKIKTYFDDERKLEELVQSAVKDTGDRISTLAKTLTESMLGAVATLIGSALAAAFKTPFSATLFRVGVLTYAAYMFFFPGLYGLRAQWAQFTDAQHAFETDQHRFTQLLGEKKVTEIVNDHVREAGDRYRRWMRATVIGYGIAICAAIVLAIIVPHLAT